MYVFYRLAMRYFLVKIWNLKIVWTYKNNYVGEGGELDADN